MAAKRSRKRVLGDLLWDENGREWFCPFGQWADAAAVQSGLARNAGVVVHGFGRPFRTLDAAEARHFWQHAREHFEVPGGAEAAHGDQEGLTYAAQIWTRDGARMVGFVEFC